MKKKIVSRKHHHKAKAPSSSNSIGLNTQVHPHAAGIDVGAEEFVAAVPSDHCAPGTNHVRSFTSFTSGVEALRDWLLACKITTAAMESTGNYWITPYDMLTAAGIEVYLVNARHVKGVPGKKTDVQDSQWLQQLHAAGLLKKSFRPALDIVPLRFLMRHRSEMIGDSARQLQLMQKTLTEMNIKLQHVFSDIDGFSAQSIITAILAGERDPAKLAALRDRRCRSPLSDIKEALRGDYRPEYLFVLQQSKTAWEQLHRAIVDCDAKIGELTAAVVCEGAPPMPEPAKPQQHRLNKNSPSYPIFQEAWRFYEVDLSDVPGVGGSLLSVLMSELGTGAQIRNNFRSAHALASWLGLCPDNRISGGKILKAKTRKIPSRLAQAIRLGVFGLQKSDTKLGDYFRRMKARLGKAEGLTAAAHKLIRILYGMIKSRQVYDENEAFKVTPQTLARRTKKLHAQAIALGYTLTKAA
jgi:hypothetical protein